METRKSGRAQGGDCAAVGESGRATLLTTDGKMSRLEK